VVLGRIYFGARPEYGAQLEWILAGLAAAAFVGHLLPIFAGFRGGKGVACALGGFLILQPKAALLGALVYVVAYGATRISSVGSLLAVLSFPLWLYLTSAPAPSFALSGVLLLLIVLRHRDNLQRLLARKESRV
jgi:glycerol-3-phosphate acyltransferase PlsY